MQGVQEGVTMGLTQAMHARRSVRGFLDKPVPRDVLESVFELAQKTPSNCNIQPWKALVASGETRDRLRKRLMDAVMQGAPMTPDFDYPGKFEGEYRTRQVECAVAMYTKMGIGREDAEARGRASLRNFEFFDAPHVVFIGMDKAFGTTVALDVGMYGQSLMLAMTAHGLGSCAQGSMRYHPDIVREEFGLSDDVRILFGISFGYEDPSVPANETRTTRENIDQSVIFKD